MAGQRACGMRAQAVAAMRRLVGATWEDTTTLLDKAEQMPTGGKSTKNCRKSRPAWHQERTHEPKGARKHNAAYMLTSSHLACTVVSLALLGRSVAMAAGVCQLCVCFAWRWLCRQNCGRKQNAADKIFRLVHPSWHRGLYPEHLSIPKYGARARSWHPSAKP